MLARILGNRTNNFIIATKIGWFPGTAANAYEPAHIRHQCEQSLINLKRDCIDLYYFHHGWFGDRDEYLDDAVEVMYKLKEEGKVRLIGQSAYSHKDFVKLIPKVKPDVLQSFANPVERDFIDDGNPTRKLMEENQISFVAFRPLYEGLLLDKYKKENPPQFENGDHRKGLSRFSFESLAKLRAGLRNAGPDSILGGKRVDIGRALSARILAMGEPVTGFSLRLFLDTLTGDTRKGEEAIRIRSPLLRRLLGRDRIPDDGIWGGNFSIPKELFYRVNGCDEDFLDGSIEDNDLGIRVLNSGGKVRSVRALAVVFHLWHPPSWNFQGEKYLHNRRILERRIANMETRCANGIDRQAAAAQ